MDLSQSIKIVKNALPSKLIDDLGKWCKKQNTFETASIVGSNDVDKNSVINTNIRSTENLNLSVIDKSLSQVFFLHTLRHFFKKYLIHYNEYYNNELSWSDLRELSILKYTEGGFYTFHTDHHVKFPRLLSMILMINDDYEGGSLNFKNPQHGNDTIIKSVKPEKNKLIMWPSGHLYPHAVEPVKKGTRYTAICWVY